MTTDLHRSATSVTGQPRPAADAPPAGAPAVAARHLLGAVLAASGLALLLTTWAVRGSRPAVIAGLPDAGPFTAWALPAVRAFVDLTAVGTIGLVAVALLLPRSGEQLGATSRRLLRRAGRWATAWTASALLAVPLTISEITARPLDQVVTGGLLREFAFTTGQTQALLSMAWLAAVVAFCAGPTARRPGAAALGLVALVAALPPAFTGHAAHGDRHTVSVIGLGLHIAGISLWCGSLLALVLYARALGPSLAGVVSRFSSLALVCFAVVTVSGGLTAWTRVGTPANLWQTDYGRVLLVKSALLLSLGALGWWHRRRTLPRLAAGRSRAFLAVATVEVVVMAATVGVAVALSRTAPAPKVHPALTSLSAPAELPVQR
ncbi:MAG: hypothetical protein QOI54_1200 [Actinomycetota bacterium]|nr:hypothetical protein [Actinomycetota bacterium]